MRLRVAMLPLLALAACAQPSGPPPTLPTGLAPAGQADPTFTVGNEVQSFFLRPRPNEPAAAARAIAELEWLAVTMPSNPMFMGDVGNWAGQLMQGRNEVRNAIGVPLGAPSQAVINGLAAAARALDAGDRAAVAAALPRNVFSLGPEQTVARLSAPPQAPTALMAFNTMSNQPRQMGRR
jgi:hypothetical protein